MTKPPLLLIPGICNRKALFYLPEGNALADYLSQYFELYPIEFPLRENIGKHWDFDFHLKEELPGIWEEVCKKAGQTPYVLGYSMGGMVAMTAQALGIIDSPGLVAVASPFKFLNIPLYPTLIRYYLKFAGSIGFNVVPVSVAGRILSSLFNLTKDPARQRQIAIFRLYVTRASRTVPVETFMQVMQWIRYGDLRDRTGRTCYVNELKKIDSPTFFICGRKDLVALPSAVRAGYDASGAQKKRFMIIENGNHMNLAYGSKAKFISGEIANWLIEK